MTRYYWRVRVWDSQGRAGAWSATQFFETGLRGPASEWTAAFIGQAADTADLTGAHLDLVPGGRPAGGRASRRPATSGARHARLRAGAGDPGRHRRRHRRRLGQRRPGQHVAAGHRLVAAGGGGRPRGPARRRYQHHRHPSENTTQSPAGMIAKLVVDGATSAGHRRRVEGQHHRPGRLENSRLQRQRLARRAGAGRLRHRAVGRQRRRSPGPAPLLRKELHGRASRSPPPAC